MKTKSPNERRINVVGLDRLTVERIRASLRRSPFVCTHTEEPLAADGTDLYVVAADRVGELPARGVPVIAAGPAGMLRSAFLGGCADFLREPWTAEELALRALAVIGREARRHSFPWGELCLESGQVLSPAGPIRLTWHEYRILGALLRSRGAPVPRQALAYAVGAAPSRTSRAIDMHVSSIRAKVRAVLPRAGRFILCIRSQGYLIP